MTVDGIFGPRTDRAVRLAQRRLSLYPPDGIVGPITHSALSHVAHLKTAKPAGGTGDPGPLRHAVQQARRRAMTNQMPPSIASPVNGMHTSREGRHFIYSHEAQRGVSNHLHHPSAGSGVTLGPGYDMKDRTRDSIASDLRAIGVAPAAAATAATGATLVGARADAFARENKQLLNLTPEQEIALLDHIIPHYESMVTRAIKISLHQQEFDALVSYAYNPGGGWRKTTALVNANKLHDAMVEIKRHVTSKGELIRSLVVRREAESRMFLYGEYK